jgi:hypothetical protein
MCNHTTLIIIALCVAIVFFLYGLSQLTAKDLESHVKNTQLDLKNLLGDQQSSFINEADNGDLIFFCGDSRGERSCRWITNSMYSHVGLIFREINTEIHPTDTDFNLNSLYIWESDLGQKSKEGPRVIKLVDKLKNYHGQPYFMWRKLKCDDKCRPTTKNILEVVHKYKDYKFDDLMFSWFVGGGGILYDMIKYENYVFCSELIAMTLQADNIKILKKPSKGGMLAAWYSPESFASDKIKGMKNGFSYSECKFIKNTIAKVTRGSKS